MLEKIFSAGFARRQQSLHLLATVQGWQGQFHTFKTGNTIQMRQFEKHPGEDFVLSTSRNG